MPLRGIAFLLFILADPPCFFFLWGQIVHLCSHVVMMDSFFFSQAGCLVLPTAGLVGIGLIEKAEDGVRVRMHFVSMEGVDTAVECSFGSADEARLAVGWAEKVLGRCVAGKGGELRAHGDCPERIELEAGAADKGAHDRDGEGEVRTAKDTREREGGGATASGDAGAERAEAPEGAVGRGVRHISVLVNPASGPLGGHAVWRGVEGIFALAQHCGTLSYRVQMSSHRGYANEYVEALDVRAVDTVVCVGGDGTLYEVANALIDRFNACPEQHQWGRHLPGFSLDSETPRNREEARVASEIDGQSKRLGRIPIALGVIPAGSGNGLAASLSLSSPVAAALAIVRGCTSPLDTMKLTLGEGEEGGVDDLPRGNISAEAQSKDSGTQSNKSGGAVSTGGRVGNSPPRTMHAFLQISFGMMTDVDFDTECVRWMGDLRFLLYAIWRTVFPRRYSLALAFTPHSTAVTSSPGHAAIAAHLSNLSRPWRDEGLGRYPFAMVKGTMCANMEEHPSSASASDFATTLDPADGFQWIGCLNTRTFAADFLGAPYATVNDGAFDVLVLPASTSRLRTLELLFDMQQGQHIIGHDSAYYKTKKVQVDLRQRPGGPNRIDVDGECEEYFGPLSIECCPALLTVIVAQ
eukprot:TRINITY_DN3237_c0_g1_i1.p1 TRINITY_DN3237_c0_g1~~TRINITY_DN3237_c0_g1_i1.p1  ORF type:complete len:636 (+),score=120.18 TRINITY_DN3237_c0_g1_i1:678-2585(+)